MFTINSFRVALGRSPCPFSEISQNIPLKIPSIIPLENLPLISQNFREFSFQECFFLGFLRNSVLKSFRKFPQAIFLFETHLPLYFFSGDLLKKSF